jgi:hypothetical protein
MRCLSAACKGDAASETPAALSSPMSPSGDVSAFLRGSKDCKHKGKGRPQLRPSGLGPGRHLPNSHLIHTLAAKHQSLCVQNAQVDWLVFVLRKANYGSASCGAKLLCVLLFNCLTASAWFLGELWRRFFSNLPPSLQLPLSDG